MDISQHLSPGTEVEILARVNQFNQLYKNRIMTFTIIENYKNSCKGISVVDGQSVTFLHKYITKIDGMEIERLSKVNKKSIDNE